MKGRFLLALGLILVSFLVLIGLTVSTAGATTPAAATMTAGSQVVSTTVGISTTEAVTTVVLITTPAVTTSTPVTTPTTSMPVSTTIAVSTTAKRVDCSYELISGSDLFFDGYTGNTDFEDHRDVGCSPVKVKLNAFAVLSNGQIVPDGSREEYIAPGQKLSLIVRYSYTSCQHTLVSYINGKVYKTRDIIGGNLCTNPGPTATPTTPAMTTPAKTTAPVTTTIPSTTPPPPAYLSVISISCKGTTFQLDLNWLDAKNVVDWGNVNYFLNGYSFSTGKGVQNGNKVVYDNNAALKSGTNAITAANVAISFKGGEINSFGISRPYSANLICETPTRIPATATVIPITTTVAPTTIPVSTTSAPKTTEVPKPTSTINTCQKIEADHPEGEHSYKKSPDIVHLKNGGSVRYTVKRIYTVTNLPLPEITGQLNNGGDLEISYPPIEEWLSLSNGTKQIYVQILLVSGCDNETYEWRVNYVPPETNIPSPAAQPCVENVKVELYYKDNAIWLSVRGGTAIVEVDSSYKSHPELIAKLQGPYNEGDYQILEYNDDLVYQVLWMGNCGEIHEVENYPQVPATIANTCVHYGKVVAYYKDEWIWVSVSEGTTMVEVDLFDKYNGNKVGGFSKILAPGEYQLFKWDFDQTFNIFYIADCGVITKVENPEVPPSRIPIAPDITASTAKTLTAANIVQQQNSSKSLSTPLMPSTGQGGQAQQAQQPIIDFDKILSDLKQIFIYVAIGLAVIGGLVWFFLLRKRYYN